MRVLVFSRTALLISMLALLCAWNMDAQNSPPQTDTPENESSKGGVYNGREIFVPETPQQKDADPEATSFSDGFLRNTRQHFGASISAFETYTPNVVVESTGKQNVAFTSIFPQIYANFQKKKVDLRLTYGATFNRYNNGLNNLNRVSQTGTAAISYVLAKRKTTLQLTNYFSSRYYNESSFVGASAVALNRLDVSPQFYTDGRRENRDSAAILLGYNLTRKISTSTSLNYDGAKYSGSDLGRTDTLSAGIGLAYQINKRFQLNTHYSHYLNNIDARFRGNEIEGLQFGGFSIKPGKGWVVSGSGGIDSTKAVGTRWITGSTQAGISKTSGSTAIDFSYHRGYSTVFPSSDVWSADTGNIYFVQRFSRQISIHTSASYIRGATLATNSLTRTAYGSAGLDIAFQNNLVLSTNYYLVSQRLADAVFSSANLHRNTVSVGLQYYLPSVSSENRH